MVEMVIVEDHPGVAAVVVVADVTPIPAALPRNPTPTLIPTNMDTIVLDLVLVPIVVPTVVMDIKGINNNLTGPNTITHLMVMDTITPRSMISSKVNPFMDGKTGSLLRGIFLNGVDMVVIIIMVDTIEPI